MVFKEDNKEVKNFDKLINSKNYSYSNKEYNLKIVYYPYEGGIREIYL